MISPVKIETFYNENKDRFYREAIGIAFKGKEAWGYDKLREKNIEAMYLNLSAGR